MLYILYFVMIYYVVSYYVIIDYVISYYGGIFFVYIMILCHNIVLYYILDVM